MARVALVSVVVEVEGDGGGSTNHGRSVDSRVQEVERFRKVDRGRLGTIRGALFRSEQVHCRKSCVLVEFSIVRI